MTEIESGALRPERKAMFVREVSGVCTTTFSRAFGGPARQSRTCCNLTETVRLSHGR